MQDSVQLAKPTFGHSNDRRLLSFVGWFVRLSVRVVTLVVISPEMKVRFFHEI